jgi:hypothetical protein
MGLIGECRYRGTSGLLSINSGNLVFTRQDRGFFSQTERVGGIIPINAILSMNIESGSGLFAKTKKLVLIVDGTKLQGIPRHEFEVADPYHFQKVIQSEIDSQLARQAQSQQAVKEVYVREVTSVVKIPCPYCGGLNEVTEKKCAGCGAAIGGK